MKDVFNIFEGSDTRIRHREIATRHVDMSVYTFQKQESPGVGRDLVSRRHNLTGKFGAKKKKKPK